MSDLITGPDRTSAAGSYLQGKGVNSVAQAVGNIPVGTDKVIFGQNGAGNYYAKGIIEGKLANCAFAKGLWKLIGIVSAVKEHYGIATHAYSAYHCRMD